MKYVIGTSNLGSSNGHGPIFFFPTKAITGDLLWLVGGAQASLMSPAELTKSLAQRPQQLRFVRGDSSKVAMEISKESHLVKTRSVWLRNFGEFLLVVVLVVVVVLLLLLLF